MRSKIGQTKLYKRNIIEEIKGSSYKTEFQVNEQDCQSTFPLPPGTLVSLVQKQEAPAGGGNTASGSGLSVPVYLICSAQPCSSMAPSVNIKD